MSSKAGWCCSVGCKNPPAWGISSQRDPYVDTHACPEHLAELADTLGDEDECWFELYRLSAIQEKAAGKGE